MSKNMNKCEFVNHTGKDEDRPFEKKTQNINYEQYEYIEISR